MPFFVASSRNFFSSASLPSGPPILKGTFIPLRALGHTGDLKTIKMNIINGNINTKQNENCRRYPFKKALTDSQSYLHIETIRVVDSIVYG